MDPAPEDWSKLIQLGGIAIPRTSTQSTVHEIVQTIQSYSDLESLHPFSFYPELEPTTKAVSKDKSIAYTNQNKVQNYQESDVYPNSKVLDYSSNYQTLHYDELVRKSPEKHNFIMDSNVRHSLPVSSSSSSDRLLTNQHLPQKHKKKLQLLHEAQLLLEKAQQSRNWAPVISPPPPPPVQPLITGTINSPEDSHIPSPNLSTWSSQLSPSRSSSHDPTDVLNHHQHNLSYENQKSPVAQFHEEPIVDPPFNKSPRSDSTRLVSMIGSSHDSSGPKQRIVLKLSRSSCGSQLSVSSSQPLEDESMERSERKKRKKESKNERRSKNLGSSPTKHSSECHNTTVVTTTNTTNVYTLNKDIINTVTNKSKQAAQIFSSETSPSLCKRNSPRKYSSHDTYSNDSSPELTYNSRKSTLNKNLKISFDNNNNNNNQKTFVDADEHDDLFKYNRRNSNQQYYQQYSSVNNIQQDTNDTFTSDIDSLCDSVSRSTHSHLLLIDQKEDDYHDESGRETPVVDYFGDEFQQQQQHNQKDQQHSSAFSSSTIGSSLMVRNVKYPDEISIVNSQNRIQSIINNDTNSNNRLDDSGEPLTHSVIVNTSRELYEEFNDFTSLSKNCSTYEHSNDQDDIKRNKFNIDEKIKLKQLNNKLKHKNSFNSSIKLLSHTGVSY
ncbi:unnamed protein product [Schistosoma intercalatum]|nr:unnamed protein product [Schistosoma intercalatum]